MKYKTIYNRNIWILEYAFGTCFGFLEVFLDSGMCFWILGSVYGLWDMFWILGSVLDPGKCFVPTSHHNNQTNLVLLEAQKSAQISATDHQKKLQLHCAVDDHNDIKMIFTNFAKYIHP